MTAPPPDLVFLSYSRRDQGAYDAVRPRLHDWLKDRLWDDQELRTGDRWDPAIRAAIDRSTVAVLVFGEGYFQVMPPGRNYILEQELPYLLERNRTGRLELLPIYWSPSRHFNPEVPERVKPFCYRWEGQDRSENLNAIQAKSWKGRLAGDWCEAKRDTLQALAHEAKKRLEECAARACPLTTAREVQEREPLLIELSVEALQPRTFRVGGRVLSLPQPRLPPGLPPGLPKDRLDRLRASGNLPTKRYAPWIGADLYRLLFEGPDGDLFPHLAEQAGWRLAPGVQAHTRAVAVEIRVAPGAPDWPLDLPWHLTAYDPDRSARSRPDAIRLDPIPLAERGWSFETVPPGLVPGPEADLGTEPPLLVLIDPGLEGAAAHADQTVQLVNHTFGFGAACFRCDHLEAVRTRLGQAPRPQVLYAYAGCALDRHALAATLGVEVPLVILNLIGETPPTPPAALVAGRKVVIAVHAGHEADRAREAGIALLQRVLDDREGHGHQHHAVQTLGARVRLWSGCTGLRLGRGVPAGQFRPNLIKLLLDRRTARAAVADEADAALNHGRTVLGLVAAGTAENQPELLPEQVWEHYRQRQQSGSPTSVRRFLLDPGVNATDSDLSVCLEGRLEPPAADWTHWLDREVDAMASDERLILSLEWLLGPCPIDQARDAWCAQWIEAWLKFGLRLADYARPRVLLAHILIVTAEDDAVKCWTDATRAAWRRVRRERPAALARFVHHDLSPLTLVPETDVVHFLDYHYNFAKRHPRLDPHEVAAWVCSQTEGVFRATVDLVERLHDSAFTAAYAALPATETPP